MISKFILLIAFSGSVFAFDKDFKVVNDKTPLEFEMMFESLRDASTTPSEQLDFIAVCKDLNENLKHLTKENTFLLLKTEIIKGTLERKFTNTRSLDVNENLLNRLEANVNQKKDALTPFARWVALSLVAELKHRRDLGLITSTPFDAARSAPNKRAEALRFSQYLTRLLPWVEKFLTQTPQDFNLLTKNVAMDILNRINSRTLLFKRFAKTPEGTPDSAIFNIPQKYMELGAEQIKRMQNNMPPEMTFKDRSKKEKLEAAKQIEKVTPLDMSPISDDVAKELEAQEKKEASPAP